MPTTRITVQNNGSLRVEGDFEIADAEGRVFGLAGRTRVTLCRCGQSKDKPFCDSAHKTCGFDSVVIARDLPPPAPKPAPPVASPPVAPPTA
ncbi:MAG: CDGSH iron-sulfur domain-containing protein [Candidatus Eisenbacteria bacterium]|uniref:CDGSH iron-sulfur domain-containing protein n=1 Tax=Eiseniibacteriota bacterium TaxID=2212470 RepID=A0A9D6L9B3_UNCEI|nr:CDGSH iron-sulfur domain-containing protein [Candidatus Eisenbacteria bacterium]